MALVLKNRVKETGTANTTVSFTLAGATTGFQSFSTIGNTNTTYYTATDTSGNWEVGIGTYSTIGPTLTRTTILSSSNAGSAVTFSGTVTVWVDYPSERAVYGDSTTLTAPSGALLPVANGGTGTSTSTGSGNLVLATKPTITVTGSGFSLVDATDNNKIAKFDLSGLTATNYTYTLPTVSGAALASIGNIGQTFVGATTFSSTLTGSGDLALTGGTATTTQLGTSATTGTTTIGGTSQSGTITIGRSIIGQTLNLGTGVTNAGLTGIINIGTGGASSSTTTITIGSVTGTSVTARGTWTYSTPLAATNMTQSTTSTSGYLSSTDWNTFNNKISMTYPSGTGIAVVTSGTSWGTTLTAPSGAIVGTTDTQNLTSKTLDNTNTITSRSDRFTLQDATDTTKQLAFNLANIATATTNTITFPLTAGTVAILQAQNTFSAGTNTFGSSTATGTIGLASGATLNGNTKTVNIGTSGVSGSTTNISIGSAVSGATSTTTLNGSVVLENYTETVYAVVDAAGVALSPTDGTIQTWTLGASRTPTAGTWAAGQSMTLMINDGTAYTVTWTTLAVTWVGGTAPTLATTGFTVIELWKVGSTIYGAYVGAVA